MGALSAIGILWFVYCILIVALVFWAIRDSLRDRDFAYRKDGDALEQQTANTNIRRVLVTLFLKEGALFALGVYAWWRGGGQIPVDPVGWIPIILLYIVQTGIALNLILDRIDRSMSNRIAHDMVTSLRTALLAAQTAVEAERAATRLLDREAGGKAILEHIAKQAFAGREEPVS